MSVTFVTYPVTRDIKNICSEQTDLLSGFYYLLESNKKKTVVKTRLRKGKSLIGHLNFSVVFIASSLEWNSHSSQDGSACF